MRLLPESPCCRTVALLLASLALAACDSGFAIHSILKEPATTIDGSSLQGLWLTGEPDDYWVLRVAPAQEMDRDCDAVDLRVWKSTDALDEPPMLEGRACLAELAGYPIAEVTTASGTALYQHYLLRLDGARIATCGGTSVWALIHKLAEDGVPGFTMDGLDFTVRHHSEFDEVFVTSPPETLRAYLAQHLRQLAETCDIARDDDSRPDWLVFERITPAPAAAPAEP